MNTLSAARTPMKGANSAERELAIESARSYSMSMRSFGPKLRRRGRFYGVSVVVKGKVNEQGKMSDTFDDLHYVIYFNERPRLVPASRLLASSNQSFCVTADFILSVRKTIPGTCEKP